MKRQQALVVALALLLGGCASHPPARAARAASVPVVRSAPTTQPAAAATSAATTTKRTPEQTLDGRDAAGFKRWLAAFREQARARGVSASTLAAAFDDAQFVRHVIELDNRQPEFHQPIWRYLDSAVSASRVRDGDAKLATYADISRRVENRYGVSRYIMAAIWGMESDYGHNFGHYETIDALATLGYDGRRESFAENQLFAALKILASGDISRADMRGSWAGAMGNTQFLPTSFLSYAVDADGDGKRDIWGSIADVMASTANYLARKGWQTGQPWGREVVLPPGFDYAAASGHTRKSTAEWRGLGVKPVDTRGLPQLDAAAIVAPAGARGPAFLVGHNFRVILRYNNATSYALAVGLLADRLAGQPGVQGSWPRDEATLSNDQVRELQSDLNALGYGGGTPDGIIGPNTRSAVRAFQHAHGQIADGFPTQALLAKIRAARR